MQTSNPESTQTNKKASELQNLKCLHFYQNHVKHIASCTVGYSWIKLFGYSKLDIQCSFYLILLSEAKVMLNSLERISPFWAVLFLMQKANLKFLAFSWKSWCSHDNGDQSLVLYFWAFDLYSVIQPLPAFRFKRVSCQLTQVTLSSNLQHHTITSHGSTVNTEKDVNKLQYCKDLMLLETCWRSTLIHMLWLWVFPHKSTDSKK